MRSRKIMQMPVQAMRRRFRLPRIMAVITEIMQLRLPVVEI